MAEDKTKLTKTEIEDLVNDLENWHIDGVWLKKKYLFDNFKEINRFLPYLANTIVNQNHHPEFAFDTKTKSITIKMTTHSKNQITRSDINLASALEKWKTLT